MKEWHLQRQRNKMTMKQNDNEIMTPPMAMKQTDNETIDQRNTDTPNDNEIMTSPMAMK